MIPVDVDRRCEFGSKQWLAAAADYLQREVLVRPELARTCFVLTEVFTDAPPHLQAPGNRIAWSMRIENVSAVVHDGEAPDADLHITVDYQRILAMGQTVYSAGAAAVDRARRELVHRAGGEPSLRRGALPDDPAIATLLGDLHDFLAALTMDNPDLQHRLARLGLSAQAAQLAEQGYCIIPHAISSEFADELRPLVHKNVRGNYSPPTDE